MRIVEENDVWNETLITKVTKQNKGAEVRDSQLRTTIPKQRVQFDKN